MTRWLRAGVLTSAVLLLCACGAGAGGAGGSGAGGGAGRAATRSGSAVPGTSALPGGAALANVRREIVATNVRLVRAEVQGDVDSLMVLWSANPEAITDGGRVYRGRRAVRGMLEHYFARTQVRAFTMNMRDLWVSGDTAFTVGLLIGSIRHGDSAVVPVRGAYMAVRVRDPRGAWLMHRWMFDVHDAPTAGGRP